MRRRIVFVSIVLAACFFLLPPNSHACDPPLGKVQFELIDNRIFVNVMINETGPYHMILDTGADLALSREVAAKAGLRADSAIEEGGVGEQSVRVQTTRVDSLRFGPVQLTGLSGVIISTADASNVFGKIPVDGYFGFAVFENYVVQHDYLKKQLTFYRPENFCYTGAGESIPFALDANIPVVPAEFDGITGRFGVDTGARSALILYGPFVAANQIAEKYQSRFQGVSGWGIGGPVRSYMVRSRSLRIGQFELRGLIARLSLNKSGATTGSGKSGLIGPDVLKQFTFICDYAHRRLIFEANSNFGIRDNYDRAGVWLAQKNDVFEVYDVISGGPADAAKLHVGDRVLAVDGERTTSLLLPILRDRWKTANPGTVVKLLVQDSLGTTRELRLVLKDLV